MKEGGSTFSRGTFLYPGALLHRYLEEGDRIPITTFRAVAERQTGIHARVGELNDAQVAELSASVCAPDRCLRVPVWPEARPAAGNGEERMGSGGRWGHQSPGQPGGGVPCPEPCSIFVSAAARVVAGGGGSAPS